MDMSNFVKKYAIVSYYVLALLLGTGITYLVVLRILPAGLVLLAAISASLAGIIITGIADGRAGLRLLFGRLLIWRVGIGWWLFAILFLPCAVLIGLFLNPLFGGETADFSNMQSLFQIIPMFILFVITAGLGEELGWTGFLIPRLQARYSALVSSIIRGVLWGFWHIPLFLFSGLDHPSLADFPYSGWVSQKGFLVAMGAFILINQIPWSIFYTWIFNNTGGSLLLVAVLHGSEVWVAYWWLSTGINASDFDNYWAYGVVMLLTAIVITLIFGTKNLSRKHERIKYQEI